MREAFTAILGRAEPWSGVVATEPYEVGWAGEAVIFVRAIETDGAGGEVATCISADGIHWADEGTTFPLPTAVGEVTFAKLSGFGHYLRFRATLPDGASSRFMVSLALKE